MLKKIGYMLLSLIVVFKHLFKRPVTLEYPEKKLDVSEKFRGKPVVNGCIKCGTCLKVCPSGAISIEEDKFIIDMKKCIFCGNCSFYCPKKAIKMSKDYELAINNDEQLKLVYKINMEKGEDIERT
jgi:formate hydrogenlyase subunit 6/NADH:ubiquinone oxidoreductase subunit I